jgi:hypothetical protein
MNPSGKKVMMLAVFLARMFQHAVAIARPKDE